MGRAVHLGKREQTVNLKVTKCELNRTQINKTIINSTYQMEGEEDKQYGCHESGIKDNSYLSPSPVVKRTITLFWDSYYGTGVLVRSPVQELFL